MKPLQRPAQHGHHLRWRPRVRHRQRKQHGPCPSAEKARRPPSHLAIRKETLKTIKSLHRDRRLPLPLLVLAIFVSRQTPRPAAAALREGGSRSRATNAVASTDSPPSPVARCSGAENRHGRGSYIRGKGMASRGLVVVGMDAGRRTGTTFDVSSKVKGVTDFDNICRVSVPPMKRNNVTMALVYCSTAGPGGGCT